MYELELYPNIRFGTFELDIIGNKEKLNDYSVICDLTKIVGDNKIRLYAENLMKSGCHDFGFCGLDKDVWHKTFDSVDIEINEEKDWGSTWEISSIEDIPDSLCMCKGSVFILCTDYDTVKKCYSEIVKANFGIRVRYIGEDSVTISADREYRVLSIERGWYRIMSELDEDYLLPPEVFEILE